METNISLKDERGSYQSSVILGELRNILASKIISDETSLKNLLCKIVDRAKTRGRYAAGMLRKLNFLVNQDFLLTLLLAATIERKGCTIGEGIKIMVPELTRLPFIFETKQDAEQTISYGLAELNEDFKGLFHLNAVSNNQEILFFVEVEPASS